MKTYNVTLLLAIDSTIIVGRNNSPRTKSVEFTVQADNEAKAIVKAKEQDQSKLSVWESYTEEIEMSITRPQREIDIDVREKLETYLKNTATLVSSKKLDQLIMDLLSLKQEFLNNTEAYLNRIGLELEK